MQSSSQGRYQEYPAYQGYPYVNPIVTDAPSIDPATAARWNNLPRRPYQGPGTTTAAPGPSGAGCSRGPPQTETRPSNVAVPPKIDLDTNPVVYIDIPEAGSQVSQTIETPGSDQPDFVEETIMYDPFENRRIDVPKDDNRSERSVTSESTNSEGYAQNSSWTRPIPPNTLNLASPCSSSTQSSGTASRPTPQFPGFMTKESLVYGGDNSNSFPMSTIPMSEFPEPPPAYTETAASPVQSSQTASSPGQTQAEPQPPQEIPPRTQVIVTENPTIIPMYGAPQGERKNMTCHHCGVRVHTLVVKEVGYMTHFIACLVFIICFPLIFVVYFTECFKHKNHYCPNCNQLIGYELPIFGQKINYVT